jgi:hypothetical protein
MSSFMRFSICATYFTLSSPEDMFEIIKGEYQGRDILSACKSTE